MSTTIDEQDYDKPFSIKIYKKIFPFMVSSKKNMLVACVLMIITSCLDAVIPLYQKYALDNFVMLSTTDGIGSFTFFYILIICTQFIISWVYYINAMTLELTIGKELKEAIFIKLQELSFSYYNQTPVGYIHTRIMSDTLVISTAVSWTVFDCIWQLTYMLAIFVAMLYLNVKLALIVITVVPFLAILSQVFQKKMLKYNREVRKENSKISNAFNECITGDKASKTLVIHEKNYKDFKAKTQNMYSSSIKTARLNAIFIPLVVFVSSIIMALILTDGSHLVSEDVIPIGTLSVFITFALSIFQPIQNLASNVTSFVSTQSSVERVFDLLEKEPEIFDTPEVIQKYGTVFKPKVTNFEKIKGNIEFKNVWFKYPDGHEYILEDFSLKIPAGTTVALVGETGSGKSTLVNLACRFFEPTKGEVLIDDINYKDRSMLWLHSNIGYVLQTPHLFSGTIRDNIAYGKLDATDEEIKKACESVSADKVIDKLNDGYNSVVYESGESLSTGEKQLLSFARAILTNPSIFVLDEATSSIDTQTENLIQTATDKLLKNRTSFVIAHRLSTIRQADLILVIKNGSVFEQGTHDELLTKKGYYYNLYKKQFQEDNANKILNNKK
ncbi:MAG: ABC transporter ATP-binding protein [bacterium]